MADVGDLGSISPIVQVGIAVGIAAGSAIAIVIGKRKSGGGDTDNNHLQGIYRVLCEMRNDNARFANESNTKNDQLIDVMRDILRRPRSR